MTKLQRSGRPDQQERDLRPGHYQQDHHHQGQSEGGQERALPRAAENTGKTGGTGEVRPLESKGNILHYNENGSPPQKKEEKTI